MLRNREEEETNNLRGVITAVHDEDIKLGQFTLLENWIPSKVTAIKKKRGGVVFTSDAVSVTTPVFCATECIDTTERGQQIVSLATAFDQEATITGNLRTSWAHINDGELYAVTGLATCGGGAMPYHNTCWQINHYIDDIATIHEVLPLPIITTQSFVKTLVGNSDRFMWATNSATGMRAYYELGTVKVDYATPDINGGARTVNAYAVSGNQMWIYIQSTLDSGPGVVQFAVYNRLSGAKTNDFYTFGASDDIIVWNMSLTTDYLYCLGKNASTSVIKLYKINRSTGVITSSLDVTALSPRNIGVASDAMIYILGTSSAGNNGLWYIKDFTTIRFVGIVANGPTGGAFAYGNGSAIWNNGTLYFGGTGLSATSTDVFKIEIPCIPSIVTPLIIASVTADATVAAGANLGFSWASILMPSVDDKILMKPAPTAGVLGVVGTTIATFNNTTALSDGSSTLAVPGGTTPGNYVLMYVSTADNRWTATSNVFTVT